MKKRFSIAIIGEGEGEKAVVAKNWGKDIANIKKSCNFASPFFRQAAIAQSVEHFIRNEKVVGSSPTRGSNKITPPRSTAISGADFRNLHIHL